MFVAPSHFLPKTTRSPSTFQVIPRTLSQNCGADTVRVITELRAKVRHHFILSFLAPHFHVQHASDPKKNFSWGVNGTEGDLHYSLPPHPPPLTPLRTGTICDMKELGVWEPMLVKTQTIKTAIEVRSSFPLFPVPAQLSDSCCSTGGHHVAAGGRHPVWPEEGRR